MCKRVRDIRSMLMVEDLGSSSRVRVNATQHPAKVGGLSRTPLEKTPAQEESETDSDEDEEQDEESVNPDLQDTDQFAHVQYDGAVIPGASEYLRSVGGRVHTTASSSSSGTWVGRSVEREQEGGFVGGRGFGVGGGGVWDGLVGGGDGEVGFSSASVVAPSVTRGGRGRRGDYGVGIRGDRMEQSGSSVGGSFAADVNGGSTGTFGPRGRDAAVTRL
eukprot:GHVU01032183.1.p1 GENE.GHVU01032183.1~~GHVU01032183.1.p1  ORF type:complete len:218 (-),score=27.70 GHVU01032183.1:71-724(-)